MFYIVFVNTVIARVHCQETVKQWVNLPLYYGSSFFFFNTNLVVMCMSGRLEYLSPVWILLFLFLQLHDFKTCFGVCLFFPSWLQSKDWNFTNDQRLDKGVQIVLWGHYCLPWSKLLLLLLCSDVLKKRNHSMNNTIKESFAVVKLKPSFQEWQINKSYENRTPSLPDLRRFLSSKTESVF